MFLKILWIWCRALHKHMHIYVMGILGQPNKVILHNIEMLQLKVVVDLINTKMFIESLAP